MGPAMDHRGSGHVWVARVSHARIRISLKPSPMDFWCAVVLSDLCLLPTPVAVVRQGARILERSFLLPHVHNSLFFHPVTLMCVFSTVLACAV